MDKKMLIRRCHIRYRFIKSLAPGAVVLDIGAGDGVMEKRLRQYRPDLEFISVDKYDFSKNFPEGKFFQVNITTDVLPISSNSIDAVFCSHVLEHITSYDLIFSEMRKVLKANGSVYIEAPSTRSLHIPALGGHTGAINFYDDPTHIHPFTRCSLYRIGKEIGLKQLKTGFARNWLYCLFFPAILFYSIIKRDRRVAAVGLWNITGWAVYLWGENIDK